MFRLILARLRKAPPVEIRLLAVGVTTGLITGAFRLGESIDVATAVGIATGFSVAMGAWLGIHLYLAVARFYTVWIDAIRKRVAEIESRILPATPLHDGGDIERLRGSVTTHIVAVSVYPIPLCFGMSAYSAIMAVLWTQLDCSCASESQGIALLVFICSSSLLVGVIAAQCIYLMRLQILASSLERRLNRGDLAAPVTLKTDLLDSSINRAERLVRLVGGVGNPAGEQTVVRG